MKRQRFWWGLLVFVMLLSFGCSPEEKTARPIDIQNFDNIHLSRYGNDLVTAAQKAPAELGDRQALYLPAGTYTISVDLTLDCPVKLANGARLEVAEGCTVQFNNLFYAYPQQIFFGKGTVRINDPDSPGYADWFCDGTEDDTAYIRKGVCGLRAMYLPKRDYLVDEIVIDTPTDILGVGGMQVTLKGKETAQAVFTIRSSQVRLENLLFDMSQSKEDTHAIYLDTEAVAMGQLSFVRLKFSRAYKAIADAGTQKNGIDGIELNNLSFQGCRDTQVTAKDYWKNVRIIDVEVTRRTYGTGDNVNMPAYSFQNVTDMYIENLDVNGDANQVGEVDPDWYLHNLNGNGVEFTGCKNVTLNRCLVEYISGTGFRIKDCSGFTFENVQAFTFIGNGFDIENLTDSELNGLKGSPGGSHFVEADNIRLTSCRNIVMNDVMLRTNDRDALSLTGCENIRINNVSVLYNVYRYAVYDGGGNSNVEVHGLACRVKSLSGNSLSLNGGVKLYAVMLEGEERIEELSEPGEYGG